MSRLAVSVLFVALALASGPAGLAFAQSDKGDNAGSEEEMDQAEKDKEARSLFYLGEEHYAAGRYAKAALLYEESYALSKRPELLLILGNAYERNGEYKKSADYLRRYLRTGKAQDAPSIKQRIARLEERVEQQRLARDAEMARIIASNKKRNEELERQVRDDDGDDKMSSNEKFGWVAVAGGGVGLATATIFYVAAYTADKDRQKGCKDSLCLDTTSGSSNRRDTFALIGDVSLAVGVASAGVGVFLLWRAHRESKERDDEPRQVRRGVMVAPEVWSDGVGVGISGDF